MRIYPREHEVLSHLSVRRSYQEIATDLGISIQTVREYVRRLYRKLDVHSAKEAVAKYELLRQREIRDAQVKAFASNLLTIPTKDLP